MCVKYGKRSKPISGTFFNQVFVQFLRCSLGLCVAALAGLAALQVILRYIIAASLMWVEEVSVIIMLWLTWLGISLLWMTKSHIVVDLLTSRLPRQIQKTMASIIDIVVCIAAFTLFIISRETLQTSTGMELDTLAVDLTIKYYPIPIGAIGLIVAAMLNLWNRHSGRGPDS